MKNRTLLYVPLLFLAAFAFSALAMHYGNIYKTFSMRTLSARLPFSYFNGVVNVSPEAASTGIKSDDVILEINGRDGRNDDSFREAVLSLQPDQVVNLKIQRNAADGKTETFDAQVKASKVERDFGFYSSLIVGFMFSYILPTFSILLGFWVVFVRPHDHLAWILLFVLLGLSSLSLEIYQSTTLVGAFQDICFAAWALAMLLFGIYFPERWSLDRKLPWIKWFFIVPLSFQILLTILDLLRQNFGLNLIGYISPVARFYGSIAFFINMIAIGSFFAALGYKAGTTKNKDARRRLFLMLYGTSLAITPSFVLILYKFITQTKGSFTDVAPFWVAITAILLMLLFPLTMAYVIVVHRALDVSVVIRQGLQYALAKNGVKILQFISLGLVILGVIWIFRSGDGFSVAEQIGFVAAGFALIPLIDYAAKNLRVWIDRKFFREAYNAEQILSDLSEEVRTMVETKPLLETVSNKISQSLHVPQVALLLRNGNAFHPAYALGYENSPLVELNENDKTLEKLKTNEPLTVYQDDQNSWVNEEIETDEKEKLQKLNSQLLLPISAKNELSGVLSLSPKLSEQPFTPSDLRLLKSVALQTGLALENSRLTEAIAHEAAQKERLNRELEIAREVQERLFPQELPLVEGLDYYGACRPALGVGGDYYDFLELPEKKIGIAIGDISGKGIGASLMMASLQASLRGQTIHFKEELGEMMKQINELLYEASTSNRYATFFYSQYEPKTKRLIFVNAGHNPPVLLRPTNEAKTEFEIIKLEDGGAVVGMLPSMLVFYKQGEIELRTGDLIVGSTDGITEAMNPQEEEWSEDAMIEELKKVYEKSSEEILHHIVAKADEFADGAKQHDDMTLVVLKVI